MTRTQMLQEIRRMGLKEAYGGWQERRLTQEEAARLLGVDETPRQLISETREQVPAAPDRRPENRLIEPTSSRNSLYPSGLSVGKLRPWRTCCSS